MMDYPARRDTDVEHAMETIKRLPYGQVEEIVRGLYRAAVAYRRTQDTGHLTRLADAALGTAALRADAAFEKSLLDAPRTPGDPERAAEVSDVLTRLGAAR